MLAPSSGVLTRLDALAVGTAAWRLGAGRSRKEDPVQAGAGVRWHARPGDTVTEGQPLMTLLTDEPDRFERALAVARGCLRRRRRTRRTTPAPIVIDRVGSMTQLSAGESLDLDAPLTRVRMGIGWDKDAGAGVARTGRPEVDLDATALQFAGGKLFDLAFYNNLRDPRRLGRATSATTQTGSGEGDDEAILVDLARVHGPVDTILFLVSSYQGHSLRVGRQRLLPAGRRRDRRGAGAVHADLQRARTPGAVMAHAASVRRRGLDAARRSARACAITVPTEGLAKLNRFVS